MLHGASNNAFGHNRRSDRAAEMLLASDTIDGIPRHAKLLDVGAYRLNGGTISQLEPCEKSGVSTFEQ